MTSMLYSERRPAFGTPARALPRTLFPALFPALLFALSVAAPVAAFAAVPAPAQPRSDTVLTEEVTAAIEEADLPIGLFEVTVRDGVAYLEGEVLRESTRARVVELALFVEGVVAVETDLTVLEPDAEEDESEGGEGEESSGRTAAAAGSDAPAPDAARRPDRPAHRPSPAEGGVGPAAATPRPDEAVRSDVVAALEDADLEIGAPQVAVEDGVVRLTGQVAHFRDWREVNERAESVAGVAAVDPDLEVAAPESRDDLVDGVRRAILRYSYYTVFDDLNFSLEDGYRIVLLGAVTEPFKKDEVEERVSKVFGVSGVDNRIEVLPLSPNDQDLRRALYYRIYRDSRFSDRANRVNPPIHIVVSRGVVALTGVVRSPVEARVLESIARSTPGVFRVVNRLQH